MVLFIGCPALVQARILATEVGAVMNRALLQTIIFIVSTAYFVEGQYRDEVRCDPSVTEAGLKVTRCEISLAGTQIAVREYLKRDLRRNAPPLDRTFVVVHHNEQKGLSAVKEVLKEVGVYGRLVEVVSNYKKATNYPRKKSI